MAIRPLGLPAGSIRALLLLALAARALLALRADGSIPAWLATALIISTASYFAARAASRSRRKTAGGEAVPDPQPLGLPAGFVRTLFLAAVAYGTWLWFDHHGSAAANMPVAWILLAFLVGIIARLVLSKLRLPEDPGASKAEHLLALVSLIAGLALPVLAATGKSADLPGWVEPLLAAVVVHYFATRS